MKINRILNNRYIKQFSLFFALSGAVVACEYGCNKKMVEDMQNEIYAKDSARYQQIKNRTKNMGITLQKQYWSSELSKINDSLKIDSAAKKAYFEGAQMVRDSIANTK